MNPSSQVSGIALHSGVLSTVSVARRAEDWKGLRFFWPGFEGPLEAADLARLRRSARRATVLEGPRRLDGSAGLIRTPEHLLAAALFFADAPLDVHCDDAEPPGLDGSALPFYRMFAVASTPSAAARRAREVGSELDWDYEGPEGSLRARPHTHFSVDSSWEDGEVSHRFVLDTSAQAPEEILPARTFITWRDWKALAGAHGSALLEGAGMDSGLLVATTAAEFVEAKNSLPESAGNTFPLVHPEAWRLADEPARHKVLDLIGDLALDGLTLPRLRLTIRNGGHALNHLLLDRLQGKSGGTHERHES